MRAGAICGMAQPYLSLEAELHDAFWEAEDNASELPLMAAFLRKHPGPALEVASGSGRLMFPLIMAGCEIEGLELSPDMLSLARARAASLGVDAVLHEGDMTHWHASRRYAALLAPAFALQLVADPLATLRHWHGYLENHGGLYLTVFIPYAELSGELPENEWYPDHQATLPNGNQALLETRHRLDLGQRLLHREHRYSVSGDIPRTHRSRQTIQWFEPSEMAAMLEASGFGISGVFADFDPQRLLMNPDADDEHDGILTYHAVKRGIKR